MAGRSRMRHAEALLVRQGVTLWISGQMWGKERRHLMLHFPECKSGAMSLSVAKGAQMFLDGEGG